MRTKCNDKGRVSMVALLRNHMSITRLRTAIWICCWMIMLAGALWGQSQKEYIYLDGKLIAVESNNPCSINPNSANAVAGGVTGSVSVTCIGGCSWTATSNDPSWITINSGGSGTGSGTVVYSVAANNAGQIRTGTITIAGWAFGKRA
jgi:hypothetical protein